MRRKHKNRKCLEHPKCLETTKYVRLLKFPRYPKFRIAILTVLVLWLPGGRMPGSRLFRGGLPVSGLSGEALSGSGLSEEGMSENGLSGEALPGNGLSEEAVAGNALSGEGFPDWLKNGEVLAADAPVEESPLRAVIFYQSEIWVQDINVMQQIANSIQENLEGHPEVAFSCYGIESLSVENAVQAAIDMNTDVLIFYSIASREALEQYDRLAENGIRLLLVDGDVQDSGRYAYIGTDNYKAGAQAQEAILQEKGADCHVAVLAPAMDTTLCSVSGRLEGFTAAAEDSGLQIDAFCDTSYDSLTAIERIQKLLDAHPQVDVLFCSEAVSGQAAADVVRDRGLEEQLMVVTYDMNERITEDLRSGALDLTLEQDTEAIGEACARALMELAQDRECETGEDLLFDCKPVTAKLPDEE